MFTFNHDLVFKNIKASFPDLNTLKQRQVAGIEFLLDSIERDPHLTRIEWPAYMMATTYHETAHTFEPVHEYGGRSYFIKRYGGQTPLGRRLGNDSPEEGAVYAGRGYVQLTGESNYEKAEDAIRADYPQAVADFEARSGRKFDLTVGDQPGDQLDAETASDPVIAYYIMSWGMRTGGFTGRALRHYLNEETTDYVNARRIINGDVKTMGAPIARAAERFERVLRAALI